MNVEYGNDNRFKKRITKQMKANFAEDQGFTPSLGSTVADSKSFDGLESACEEIETKGQLVANQLERDEVLRLQHPTEFSPPPGVAGFYASVKKGITALKKTNFKGLPRSDIASLESYLERLGAFDFEAKFAELLVHFAPVAAAPVHAAREQVLIDWNQVANDALDAFKAELHAEMEQWRGIIEAAAGAAVPVAQWRHHESLVARTRYNMEREVAKIAKNEKELNGLQHGRSTKVERKGLVEKDMALVVPAFKVFLESLATGLQSYKSGVSGKNIIVGSGAYHVGMGGADYLPRRFM
jgi:hypothetical protein